VTVFHTQLRARALGAVKDLAGAIEADDDYAIDVHRDDLNNIAQLAREHDISFPELPQLGEPGFWYNSSNAHRQTTGQRDSGTAQPLRGTPA
jgi:hypothetical protein